VARILFTSRAGGVSVGQYQSMNLGAHVGDDPSAVARNRNILKTEFSCENMVFMEQVHGSAFAEVTALKNIVLNVDALITREKNLALVVQVADCIPLLIHSNSQVAAVHVGRRGLAAGVIENVLSNFRSNGEINIKAELGPAICVNCYEVDPDTYRRVAVVVPGAATSQSRHHLDLVKGAISILESWNISIHNWGICTRENSDYFSFRRDSQTGRQVGVISL
jgi:YfiH family protein